jgi:hypothetical protein
MKTLHEWLDSTFTSSNEWFYQIDLSQETAKTTLDVVVAQLDALHTTSQSYKKIILVFQSRTLETAAVVPAVYHATPPITIHSLKSNLKSYLLMENMILLHILIGS